MFLLNDKNYNEIAQNLQKAVAQDRVKINEPLSLHTTFKIGGPADLLVFPANMQEVAGALKIAEQNSLPVTVLGNGSNVLVLDKGIRGLVLKISEHMSSIRRTDTTVFAQSGALLSDIAQFTAGHALTGFEFAVGIPGSIGGAVFMNAGAYDGEIRNVILAVNSVSPKGEIRRFLREELAFGYRHSIFQDNHHIICEVEIGLAVGNQCEIEAKMFDLTDRRESKQPLEMPSAGSTFKRPPGFFAGTLIEQSGLKGFVLGGAQVSEKHAGFIVNAGGATALDVLNLIKEVQRRVFDKFGVMLQPEVRIMGEQ